MDWTEIQIKVASKDLDEASNIIQMWVSNGIYIEDYSDFNEEIKKFGPIEIIDEDLLRKDKENAVVHVYINPEENPVETRLILETRLGAAKIEYEVLVNKIDEEDWANNWKKYFKPFEIGQIVVKPTWEDYVNNGNKIILEIDPNMSFGSGQHETTRLCMEFIQSYVNKNTVMLDVGTGSGILAVEALLLGAKSVEAVDIDPLSVKIAKENAKQNKVENRINVYQSDLAKSVSGKYNLITANIVADIIIRLLDDIPRLLEDDGVFIASGIILEREADVIAALKSMDFNIIEVKRDRGWLAVSAERKDRGEIK